jgi:hypothetical protein
MISACNAPPKLAIPMASAAVRTDLPALIMTHLPTLQFLGLDYSIGLKNCRISAAAAAAFL